MKSSILLYLLLLASKLGLGCSAVPISVEKMVFDSESIVVARVSAAKPGTPLGTITLKIGEVLKGPPAEKTLTLKGNIFDYAPRTKGRIPYESLNCARASGCGGCSAYQYKMGLHYLLFLRGGNIDWAPLAATNEEVSEKGDPWVTWVRQKLLALPATSPPF